MQGGCLCGFECVGDAYDFHEGAVRRKQVVEPTSEVFQRVEHAYLYIRQ